MDAIYGRHIQRQKKSTTVPVLLSKSAILSKCPSQTFRTCTIILILTSSDDPNKGSRRSRRHIDPQNFLHYATQNKIEKKYYNGKVVSHDAGSKEPYLLTSSSFFTLIRLASGEQGELEFEIPPRRSLLFCAALSRTCLIAAEPLSIRMLSAPF